MPNFNLNKLVTGFLVLAIVASTAAFIFSGSRSRGPNPDASPDAAQKKNAIKAPKNAFVETLPATASSVSVAGDGLPAVTATDNLTENMAQRLAREMVAENPTGPQITEEGLSLVLPQNTDSILGKVLENRPELEAEIYKETLVVIPDEDIKITSNYTSKDIAAYADAINGIVSDNLTQAQIEAVIRNLPQAEALSTLKVMLDSALIQAKKISVPAPLANFHKSFLQIIAYQRKALTLAGDQNDPLRASLILEESAENYDLAVSRFNGELQKATDLLQDLSGASRPNKFSGLLEDLFSVKKVHAFLGIGGISFDPALIAHEIRDFSRRILIETLKDRLIHQLVRQVIIWVQGGGKPQFVTNWRTFLDDAANKAAGDVIYKLAPQMCSSFGPLVRLTFTAVPPIEQPVVCTLDQVVANVRDFYDDFRNGGWIAYTTALQPQNNFFGALMITSDIVAIEAAKEREAAEKRASAGGGFTGQAACSKEEYRNKRQECIFNNPNNPEVCNLIPDVTYKECVEYQVTTPGSVTQQITTAALNSPVSRIVNAQDIAALTSAFVNAALNKLIQAGQKGLRSLFGGSSSASASQAGVAAPPPNFSTFCVTLDESIAAVKRFHDFAQANQGQLKSDSENFHISADATIWSNRAMDASSPVNGLMNEVASFKDPDWDPLETQLARFSNWLDAVITSLIKDEDLDLDGPWNMNNPPTQGARGVIRMTANFATYLERVKTTIGACENLNPGGLGNIPDPNIGGGGGGGGVCSDSGDGTINYSSALQTAIDDVIARNPNGIADAPNTTENAFTFLNEVAASLQAAGFNATTDVKNGNDNPNTGDLIAIWRPGDSTIERYDAVANAGAGDQPMREAATADQFTGDIPLSCAGGSGGGGRSGGSEGGSGEEPSSLLADVQAERAKYDATITQAEAGTILNAIAWENRDAGWGLSRKTSGSRCPSPAGEIACDILHHQPTNVIVDVFGSGPNDENPSAPANPQWMVLGVQTDSNRPWVAPVQP